MLNKLAIEEIFKNEIQNLITSTAIHNFLNTDASKRKLQRHNVDIKIKQKQAN